MYISLQILLFSLFILKSSEAANGGVLGSNCTSITITSQINVQKHFLEQLNFPVDT